MQSYGDQLIERTKKHDLIRRKELAKQTLEKLAILLDTLNKFLAAQSLPAPDSDIYSSQVLSNQYANVMGELQPIVYHFLNDFEKTILGEKKDELEQEKLGNLPESVIRQEHMIRGIADLCRQIEMISGDNLLLSKEGLKKNLQHIYLIVMDMPTEIQRVLDPTESRDEAKRKHNADVLKKIKYVKARLDDIFINHAVQIEENLSLASIESPQQGEQDLSEIEEMGLFTMLPQEVLEPIFNLLPAPKLFELRTLSKGCYATTLDSILMTINRMPPIQARKFIQHCLDNDRFRIAIALENTPLGIVFSALCTDDLNTIDREQLAQAVLSPAVKRFRLFYDSARLTLAVLNPSASETVNEEFRGLKLIVNLPGACVEGLDLSNADLSGANLSKTMLKKVHMDKANLNDANLSEATLLDYFFTKEATLNRANLSKLNSPNGMHLIYTKMHEANLSEANLVNFHIDQSCDLTNANFRGAVLKRPILWGKLEGVNFTEASITDIDNCSLKLAKLGGAILCNANLKTTLLGADLSNVDLSGVDLNNVQVGIFKKGSRGESEQKSFTVFFSIQQCSDAELLRSRLNNLSSITPMQNPHQALNLLDAIAHSFIARTLSIIRDMKDKGKFDITEIEKLIACTEIAINHPLFKSGYFHEPDAPFNYTYYYPSTSCELYKNVREAIFMELYHHLLGEKVSFLEKSTPRSGIRN